MYVNSRNSCLQRSRSAHSLNYMDPLQLLTRSSKRPNKASNRQSTSSKPSGGPNSTPQLFGKEPAQHNGISQSEGTRKRKRGSEQAIAIQNDASLEFFGSKTPQINGDVTHVTAADGSEGEDELDPEHSTVTSPSMTEEEKKSTLRQHKLKVTVVHDIVSPSSDSPAKDKKSKRTKTKDKGHQDVAGKVSRSLYPEPVMDFRKLKARFGISQSLAHNILEQGYTQPTEVQMASLPILLGHEEIGTNGEAEQPSSVSERRGIEGLDLLTVAPTGSGKTLAFMIPLIHALIRLRHSKINEEAEGPKAVILAPTKELANQITNEGRKLAAKTGIRITSVRKGMHLGQSAEEGVEGDVEDRRPAVKSDVLVSTPLTLVHAMKEGEDKTTTLPGLRYLVLDEADVLLDPLFREQTLSVWNAASHPALRVSLWSATMGSNIEELVKQVIGSRVANLLESGGFTTVRAPLVRLVVGLKDSAVPNIDHRMTYAASEQGKLMALRELLHPKSAETIAQNPLRAPFLVFTQTIERAVALHSELLYDIPAEAGGIARIAVLHSDLSDTARDKVMTRFRKGEIWVLITTDLLSRGVDFRGVNGVVNYDIPTSSAAYVHRVGRTGRAGREGGVAVTLYTKEDIPYVKNVANVIAAAQKQKGLTKSEHEIPQWLLDSLPDVSKQDKQKLKKRGVEARRSTKGAVEKKGGNRTRISTKSGFVRRQENNRRGAIQATKRVQGGHDEEDKGAESDFGGFAD